MLRLRYDGHFYLEARRPPFFARDCHRSVVIPDSEGF
jgi:hypothetical protein